MILLATALAITAALSAFMFRELANAPEGYQDETGFNVVWRNNSEQVQDVSCVWAPMTA